MNLYGISFKNVANASGAQGFFDPNKEYPHYWILKLLGLNTEGLVRVVKTITDEARPGNVPVQKDGYTVKGYWHFNWFRPYPFSKISLNAAGLTNPGAHYFLNQNIWQTWRNPFFLSFMAVGETLTDRLTEATSFKEKLQKQNLHNWNALFGLEINVSCPNTGHDTGALYNEVGSLLDIFATLRIPLQVKFNAIGNPQEVSDIAQHEFCHAIVMGNTMPFGREPHNSVHTRIDWQKLWHGKPSPLAHLGGGGLSGPPLLPVHTEWIRTFRGYDSETPVWGCGGIFSMNDAQTYKDAGATGIQLGTGMSYHPRRVADIISCANDIFSK